ncbi:MAG: hypothetical protein PVS3B3_30670 [Ktedonobacteraceae bacterium]
MRKRVTHFLFHGLIAVFLTQIMTSGQLLSSYSFTPLDFSGYRWNGVNTDSPQYPGPNVFSSSRENVWVDSRGSLHLRVTYRNGVWNCAEVVLEKYLGYGTYTFYVDGNFTDMDQNVVVGMFLYRDDTHEYDIELSQWGTPTANTLQYSLQPYTNNGNSRMFPTHLKGVYTSHQIQWTHNAVEFVSLHGHYQKSPGTNFLIANWKRPLHSNEDIPGANLHINVWLNEGQSAQANSTKEIVISRFFFTPSQHGR